MEQEILISIVGFSGMVVGASISTISLLIIENKKHKRWLIEKRIEYLIGEIQKVEESKRKVLIDLSSWFKGGKFVDSDSFIYSVPVEVIKIMRIAFEKHVVDEKIGNVALSNLSKKARGELLADVASAFENKKLELQRNIKDLLS
jgi:hypothetical protein